MADQDPASDTLSEPRSMIVEVEESHHSYDQDYLVTKWKSLIRGLRKVLWQAGTGAQSNK